MGFFSDAVSSVSNVVTKVANSDVTAKVMPVTSMITGTGRENLMKTYQPVLGPAMSMLAPGAGAAAPGIMQMLGGGQAQGAGDFGISSILSGFLNGGASRAPAAPDQPQPVVVSGGGGGGWFQPSSDTSAFAAPGQSKTWLWIILAVVGVVVLLGGALLLRGKK